MYLEYVWRGSFMAIKVRGKASFEVSFTFAGQRYRRSFRCRAAALEWEGRAKAALERGQAIPAAEAEKSRHHDLSLGGLLSLAAPSLWDRQRSAHELLRRARTVVADLGLERRTVDLDAAIIQQVVAGWRARGLGAATINGRLSALGQLLQWAEQAGIIQRAPRIRLEKRPEGRTEWLSVTDERRILDYFSETGPAWMADLVSMAMDTGMRLNELMGLTPAHLCLAPGLSVRLAAAGTKEKRARLIPLTPRARSILERRGAALDDNEVFFDYPLHQVGLLWRRMRLALNLTETVVFHTLRHTFGSRLAQKGASVVDIQNLMGHSSLVVTARYLKTDTTSLARSIDLL